MLERGLSDLHGTVLDSEAFQPRTARRSFRLALTDYAQARLLGPLLASLRASAPLVDLFVVHATNIDRLAEQSEVDLSVFPIFKPLTSAWGSLPLFADKFVCMARVRHPNVKSKLTLIQYTGLAHVVVAPAGGSTSVVDTELARRGLSRHVALRVPSFLVAPVVVSQSDLVNTGPERLARRLSRVYPVRLLPPPLELPEFTTHLIWHKRFERDPAHMWIRDVVTRVAKDL